MFRVVTFAAVLAIASANCLRSCRFHFCEPYDVMPLYNRSGQIDVSLTPSICHRRSSVGVANSGEAYVEIRGRYLPISAFPLNDGRAYIAPHFFKTYTQRRSDTSGVGHQKLQFEEDVALAGRCVVLPLTHVQILERAGGNIEDNVVLRNRMSDCVSFRVRRMGRTGVNAWYERAFPDLPDVSGVLAASDEPVVSEEPMPTDELLLV